MPTWLRIIILLVCYLTYIAFSYICICKKAKDTKKNFLILTVGETVILILLLVVMFPNHIFFSYPDMLLAIGLLLLYSQISILFVRKETQKCENNVEDNTDIKAGNVENSNTADKDSEENDDETDEGIDIEDFLKIIFNKYPLMLASIIFIATSVIFSTNSTTTILDNKNIINPVQVSEDIVDVVDCYEPSVDLRRLKLFGNNESYGIAHVENGKKIYYYWYFVQESTGEICRSSNVYLKDIYKININSDTHTNIQKRVVYHELVYTEIKPTSEEHYVETIETESKYILNINPNEVVNVSE